MNYMAYYDLDVINGWGTRCTLFVSGCQHRCFNCFQKKSWSFSAGHLFTQELEDKIIADLTDTRIKRRGLSLSGGDPLHPFNVPEVLKLVRRVREESPSSDIWCWTGYVLEELDEHQQELVELLDVVVDGKFVDELKDLSLEWRGSSNQRVHYLSQRAKDHYDQLQK
ncbi:anaerobic ribonucleoside-triphosphate reductase-activating protein [Vibrio parahaemolyticus]|uniref:anaerobic ribonucleoside-triphosphate reductase-activating protein n=1 Tax=Vibrio TaxID=662 RepID=UPI00111DB23B|nr:MULTISPECIES: anaerobic ribonucleoside-triphosphate reductase-activating protein [Vibrio]EGQ8057945.1 anaerobic ribonucleoside-triphosphate reductase-activating protein [Vibrio parahaemolyticus]EGR0032494.1 anaerobic ribonucleoside-triphosphate reductase-activating protein [Vibrio parahaemolyticus]EHH1101393.1 anaerobic ribonucleoside-triphosphate reductase-activating protein [Vibrio parahaemolyticus]EHH1247931.1 anaerobic ribonucleoside-triphosphate reductase-activating protein [Vibrio para